MQLISVAVVVAAGASAGASPKRLVDVSISLKRTSTDIGSETNDQDPACVTTGNGRSTFTETVHIVGAKVPMTDDKDALSFSLHAKGSISGTARYEYTIENHTSGCQSSNDDTGDAQANVDAKDVRVELSFDKKTSTGSLMISPDYGEPKGRSLRKTKPKSGPAYTVDLSRMLTSQAAMVAAGMAPLNLSTAATWADAAKSDPTLVEKMKLQAQAQPMIVSTKGGIDINFSEADTIDLVKRQPPSPSYDKKTGTRNVSTEVSVHITPSK